jgi:signal transduction histidine kinase
VGAAVSEAVPFGRNIEALLTKGTGRTEVLVGEGAGRRTFEASVMPVEVKGELRAHMILLRDITERKRMEEALHAANARLGLLTSMTRHDLLNKLTVIDGYVALARQEKDPEKAKALLSKLGLASDAARALITFTKDYESVGIRAPSWYAVDQLFNRAADQLSMDQISVTVDTGDLEVYADAMLEKVFYNLLDNTLRHGRTVTSVALTCREEDDHLVLAYQDDGVGIPAADKESIFERGFGQNTGLGLFLIKEVLAITGIAIKEVGEPSKGAMFELAVPRGAYRFETGAHQSPIGRPVASES